jgi:PadR family transcriptional regulator PadR
MRAHHFNMSLEMRTENTNYQDLYSGLIRIHILHHACRGEVFGLWMIEELERHGYRLSPGTMYPLVHSLEKRSLLSSKEKREGRRYGRLYRATPAGRRAFMIAKEKVSQLFNELFEGKRHSAHERLLRTVERTLARD